MALPRWKITFVFGAGERGWTESWFSNRTDLNVIEMKVQADTIGALRANMLGQEARIKAIRISNPNRQPDSALFYVNLTNQFVQVPCASFDLSLYSRFFAAGGERTKAVFLRGFPDDVEVNGGRFEGGGAAAFTIAFDAWSAIIVDRQWGWRGVSGPPPEARVNVAELGNGIVEFTALTDVFSPYVPGDKLSVRVSGFPKQSGLNRSFVVRVVSPTRATTTFPIGVLNTTLPGTIRLPLTDFIPAVFARPQKVGPRKAGAPLLVTPGRRSAR